MGRDLRGSFSLTPRGSLAHAAAGHARVSRCPAAPRDVLRREALATVQHREFFSGPADAADHRRNGGIRNQHNVPRRGLAVEAPRPAADPARPGQGRESGAQVRA